jgi:hypothetical protein
MNSVSAEKLNSVAPILTRRAMRMSLLVGIIFCLALGISAIFDPAQFFRAYLPGYLWCLNIALGSLPLLMMYHLTGGAWGFLIRRILEASVKMLPLLALGFIPIALGANKLYLWAQPNAVASNELLQEQSAYMNLPFWSIRAIIYFVLWSIIAFFLCRWSRQQDRAANPRADLWLNTFSGIGLVIYGITIHFASVDWVISLQPEYHSTISGPLLASQQLLSALSLAILTFTLLCDRKPFADLVSAKTLNDLGNLLLTFVVLWSYMWWFEFMLIWIANLPADVVWYIDRVRGGWLWTAIVLVVIGFAIPFLLLLQRANKQRPSMLSRIACVALLMQLLFAHWMILPAFRPVSFADIWMSLLAPPALGGIWLALFIWKYQHAPLLAQNDRNAVGVIRLRLSEDWESQWEESLAHG